MLVPFLIMFREGIEAALLVGIIASYLKQSGRSEWMKPVWIGVVAAIFLCFGVGIFLKFTTSDFPQKQQELFAGVIGIIAIWFLTWMVFWMKQAARSMKSNIQSTIDQAIVTGDKSGFALVGMAFLAVAREGLESVFFLLATFTQNVGIEAPIGAVLGIAASVAVGFGIYQGGVHLNLKQFFRWTGIFIIFVAAGLLAGSLRAFHEAGVWNLFQEIVFDLSNVLPRNGFLGTILAGFFGYSDAPTVGEVFVYLTYLIPAIFLFLRQPTNPQKVAT